MRRETARRTEGHTVELAAPVCQEVYTVHAARTPYSLVQHECTGETERAVTRPLPELPRPLADRARHVVGRANLHLEDERLFTVKAVNGRRPQPQRRPACSG